MGWPSLRFTWSAFIEWLCEAREILQDDFFLRTWLDQTVGNAETLSHRITFAYCSN